MADHASNPDQSPPFGDHPEAARYPHLRGLDYALADKWLTGCRREAGLHLPTWARTVRYLWLGSSLICLTALTIALMDRAPGLWVGFEISLFVCLAMSAVWAVAYERYIERAVERRMNEEARSGRLRYCLGCDFDLRGTVGEKCPECGAWAGHPRGGQGSHQV
jgi:hypothetical protein